ncbi:hypothetical protein DPMN_027075 [Dreissena polymorpha]|uniref:Uncharacterized protein n=1 Tax=Dreissena polymorpha TaxID=45954 RepID=A0A9D4REW9_DREPO|nr:hypothetical protein DPMN_027075 [Dreissena polymorpha]
MGEWGRAGGRTDMSKAIYPLFFEGGHENVSTKFHEDWTINVTSRTTTIFELKQAIIRTNVLPESHEDRNIYVPSRQKRVKCPNPYWTKNLTSRVLTSFFINLTYFKRTQDWDKMLTRTNALPPSCQKIVLTKFHEDWTKHVISRMKNAPPPGRNEDIIETNILTKFHEDWTKNKNAQPPGCHVLQPTRTVVQLVQDIIGTNFLTKKHAPHPGYHVFQPTVTIFELVQYIIRTNLLTKFHEDWTINVAYKVLTWKKAPPPGSHAFQPTGTLL